MAEEGAPRRQPPPRRDAYGWFTALATRWADNDCYGHVNNAAYYIYFDTAISEFLMREGGFRPLDAAVVGFAVENGCRFHRPLAYPDRLEVGLRVDRLGRTSVRYALGIFKAGEDGASADGHFVHVFVARGTGRPCPIPDPQRAALERLRR